MFFLKKLKKKNVLKFGGYQKAKVVIQKRDKRPVKPGSQKTIKQLLGELYADKVYLEKILNDDSKLKEIVIKNRIFII